MEQPQEEKQIQEGKFFAIISYIIFLCVVSLILKKDNKFTLYHAKQGLVLFVFEVVACILTIIPILGFIVRVVGIVGFSIISLWGILQALMGGYCRIPVISKIADKIVL